ncbi:hypothetical protein M3649_17805 [Ureibacillus chungkukjangi]|uniref:hypothetical protein n=1 Tax=Ureibacillus chungkukjangi TaxID=1202712 RepID=UPI0020425C13|nr:hypothetical protein [Ureibacillus chungkukjangi]MCM3389977.1 hypothetical protein [Ureibacillus chungkukjangi]
MHSAILSDGHLITANQYYPEKHGVILYCMDQSCKVPVHYVKGDATNTPHFKTSGKGESIHKESCGFAKKLSFKETVSKVSEYQESISEQGIREFLVKLNMDKIDPDYVPKEAPVKDTEKEKKPPKEIDEKLLKEKPEVASSLSSLKSIKKLFQSVSPDLLASIIISIKGNRIPISKLICHYQDAHQLFWEGDTFDVPYFVYGIVEKVTRREKVWYINLSSKDYYFTLVIFEKYFKHFTYRDEDLLNHEILATGYLRKNEFQKDKPSTEMVIKSDKYIEFL